MRRGYSYIVSDGKIKYFRSRRSYGEFIADTVAILCVSTLFLCFFFLTFLLHPMIPVCLIGGGGAIALIAYIRWKIWDAKWRKENNIG